VVGVVTGIMLCVNAILCLCYGRCWMVYVAGIICVDFEFCYKYRAFGFSILGGW